jgi:hypothetical protein
LDRLTLRGGLSVGLGALQLVWAWEARGLSVTVDAHGINLTPAEQTTDDDKRAATYHCDDIGAIVRFVDAQSIRDGK